MKKSNIKRILSGVFAMLMVCCIAFTTQGLTVNAAIVSGGKKNYSYKELKTDLKQLQKKYKDAGVELYERLTKFIGILEMNRYIIITNKRFKNRK